MDDGPESPDPKTLLVPSTGEEERLLQAARPWLKDIVLFALHTYMRMVEFEN